MSASTEFRERWRESAFALGAFFGMGTLAIGIATLVLAMSVGLRRGEEYIPPGAGDALLAVGAVLVVAGILARLYRGKLTDEHESRVALAGLVGALVGAAMVLFSAAAETTVSAPFLATPSDKVLLFLIAYGLIAAGLVLIRASARIVGW